jgi:GNAT superfamily N-acetyltransferase
MPPSSLSRSFEARLEGVELEMYTDFYRAIPGELADRLGIRTVSGDDTSDPGASPGPLHLVARGFDHPMFNRTLGILERATEVLEAARILFPGEGIRRWMVQVPPWAETPAFREAARSAGLVRHRGWAKHAGPLDAEAPEAGAASPDSGLRIRRIDGGAAAGSWARIVTACFAMPPDFQPWLAALATRPSWRLYLALDGEEPVAAAALFRSVRDPEVAQLNFAGTLEGHRGRGAQSALVARRLAEAREAGARWIVTETDEELPDRPNPSYRNMVRLGLPVRYVRANWGPPKPSVS